MKPMTRTEALKHLKSVQGWRLSGKSIYLETKFRDFRQAMRFIVGVGRIAEAENHHPDICLYSWNRVRLTLSTHAISGLSVNDFIVAAKINRLRG